MSKKIIENLFAFAIVCAIAFGIFWTLFFKISPVICVHFNIVDGLGRFIVFFIFGYMGGIGIPLAMIFIYLLGLFD